MNPIITGIIAGTALGTIDKRNPHLPVTLFPNLSKGNLENARLAALKLPYSGFELMSPLQIYSLGKIISKDSVKGTLFDVEYKYFRLIRALIAQPFSSALARRNRFTDVLIKRVEDGANRRDLLILLQGLAVLGTDKGIKKLIEILRDNDYLPSQMHSIFTACNSKNKGWIRNIGQVIDLIMEKRGSYFIALPHVVLVNKGNKLKEYIPQLIDILIEDKPEEYKPIIRTVYLTEDDKFKDAYWKLAKNDNDELKILGLVMLVRLGYKEAIELMQGYLLDSRYSWSAYNALSYADQIESDVLYADFEKEVIAESRANLYLQDSFEVFPESLKLLFRDTINNAVTRKLTYVYLYKFEYTKGKKSISGLVFIGPEVLIWQTVWDSKDLYTIDEALEAYVSRLTINYAFEIENRQNALQKFGRRAMDKFSKYQIEFAFVPLLILVILMPALFMYLSNVEPVISPPPPLNPIYEVPVVEVEYDLSIPAYQYPSEGDESYDSFKNSRKALVDNCESIMTFDIDLYYDVGCDISIQEYLESYPEG